MDDLISRQKTLQAIEKCAEDNLASVNHNYLCGFQDAAEVVENMPPERPVSDQSSGKWLRLHDPYRTMYQCDQCGEITSDTVMGEPRYKYCPMCGTKMENATSKRR